MTPKSRPKVTLSQIAFGDLKKLQGNVRRQMIIAIDGLEENPRPSESKQLKIEDDVREIRRLRQGKWRIIYAIVEEHPIVLGIRRRPPYDYDDVQRLLEEVD
jgi:mRNA-degrading endonuclease RelE of RelBE toxin-antitoxin system